MKSTIKLNTGKAIVVQPDAGAVKLEITVFGAAVASDRITTDQCSALIFSLEQCLEVLQAQADAAKRLAA